MGTTGRLELIGPDLAVISAWYRPDTEREILAGVLVLSALGIRGLCFTS